MVGTVASGRDGVGEREYLDAVREIQRKSWPPGVSTQPRYPLGEIPLTEYLRRWAALQPDKTAFVFYGAEISYREVDEQSDRFAALMLAHGARKGDRIAVFLPNCPQFIFAFYGILKLGCIHVPINPMFKEHELAYELNDAGAEILVAQDQLMPLVRAVRAQTSLRIVYATSYADVLPTKPAFPVPTSVLASAQPCEDALDLMPALRSASPELPDIVVGLDDVAALNYTGGTTGMPKGCVHTQRDMIYIAAAYCTVGLITRRDDVSLCFLQAFWISGEDLGLIFPVFTGSTCVFFARWDPLGFMAAVQRYKVTVTSLLADNLVEVMDHPDVRTYDLRSLRAVRASSFVKKFNAEYRRRWLELTGCIASEATWGMTETHAYGTFTTGLHVDDFDVKAQPIFVGLPLPGTEIKICDFETGEHKPLNEEGEICMRSPSMLKSYWNKEEATAEALRDGWLHSGDIGLLDDGGFLHFLGRRKEMLKIRGMSVFPAEIEALLGQHPAIVGSGVIGRPDDERGEVPVAFIRLAPADRNRISSSDLTAWCRQNMAVYKVPEIRIVDELPMTATGKVKKNELSLLL